MRCNARKSLIMSDSMAASWPGVFVILLACLLQSLGAPNHRDYYHDRANLLSASSSEKADLKTAPNLLNYLTQFGYLPQSETEAQLSEEQMTNAIRNLQFNAGLNVTGDRDPATMQLLLRPRCGVPDVSHSNYRNRRSLRVKRYNLQGERWPRTNLTWCLRTGPTRSSIHKDVVRRELSHALEMWARETRLTFLEVAPASEECDLRVDFFSGYHDDGYPFDGPGSVLAHAFFPGGGRGGDVHFDDNERWSGERSIQRDSTSVFVVSVHEFGHSLGLSHSSVEGSLMFPWYSGIPANYKLPQDDLSAIQHLYGIADQWDYEPPIDQDTSNEIPALPDDQDESPSYDNDEANATSSDGSASNGIPDKCDTNFDAVAVIRSEMWVFKGRFFWRIDRNGGSRDDPIELSSFWYGLPGHIERVDAVYERPDHKIVFFVGKEYYILTGNSQLDEGPLPITRLGLPESLERVDGAMRWGWNQKTYFFADTMYWRFDEEIQHVELDYPRDISIWSGVPYNVDAVFQHTDGITYFFKGRDFWQFDDVRMRVKRRSPTRISQYWMRCPKEIKDPFKSPGGVVLSAADRTHGNAYLWLLLPLAVAAKFS